ncbi:MarR family winged helix-turn-helix transcriptional regulator [Roseivirga sp. BDSF3-8]|uniref:MarR family winged helix-turn-helix transcriptional regulator n=1 Tax=Roseivirga sp. BDSF3-8 TaxID=3241598 RepID=UPI0035320B8D
MHTEDILRNIRKIIRALNLESKKLQKEHGLTITQLLVLRRLQVTPQQQVTQKELCEQLNLSRSTVTGVVDRMVKKNLLERLPKKNDKRTSYVGLTTHSLNMLSTIPDPIQVRLIKKLSEAPDAEQKKINESLYMLTVFLGIDQIEASPLLMAEEFQENKGNQSGDAV